MRTYPCCAAVKGPGRSGMKARKDGGTGVHIHAGVHRHAGLHRHAGVHIAGVHTHARVHIAGVHIHVRKTTTT